MDPEIQKRYEALSPFGKALAEEFARIELNAKAETLAKVRRVVEDVQKSIWGAPTDTGSAVTLCCSEILARLEAFK